MIIPIWLSFLIVISLILIFSKKELSIVLLLAGFLFGILVEVNVFVAIFEVISDITVIILALAVLLIPILGDIMEKSGLIMESIKKLNVSKKTAIMLSPALFGLLPIPGGALLSAPLVDQIDPKNKNIDQLISINIWFRHAYVLIYPLSTTLIICSEIANLSLYYVVATLIIPFIIMVLVGYFMLVKSIKKEKRSHERDLKKAFRNLIPIITAPVIDLIGRTLFPNFPIPELFLLAGLIISLVIAFSFTDQNFKNLPEIAKETKIWRFPLLIIAVYFFLNIFIKSGIPEFVGGLDLNFGIFMLISFFLGYSTGRVQLPFSLLIPIYLTQYSLITMPILNFIFIYLATFTGYLITPLHPCVSYSIEYFKSNYKSTIKTLGKPDIVFLAFIYIFYFITLVI